MVRRTRSVTDEPDDSSKNSRTPIIVAVITVVGAIVGAFFANWDKVFPPTKKPEQHAASTSSVSPNIQYATPTVSHQAPQLESRPVSDESANPPQREPVQV